MPRRLHPLVLLALAIAGCGSSSGTPASNRVTTYRTPSESMLPTLHVGDYVKVDLDAYTTAEPKRGDIVVFYPPAPANGEGGGDGPNGQCGTANGGGRMCPINNPHPADVKFIKRIVGLPGDRIALRNGHLVLNGKLQNEPFIKPCQAGEDCNYPTPITVLRGTYFMLGDNRGESDDSRFWGPVPLTWIVGKVTG